MMFDNEIRHIKSTRQKKDPIWDKFLNKTNFLILNPSKHERLWYIKNNIQHQVKCPVCGKNPVKIDIKNDRPSACGVICKNNRIDEKTGLSFKNSIGLKSKQTKSKINTRSGKSYFQEIAEKSARTMKNTINPETGKSKAQEIAEKSAKTKKKKDPKTGLSIYDIAAKKQSKTLNSINPKTGIKIKNSIKIKTHKTLSKINPNTGLTGYQENLLKQKQTLSKINPNTGLTGYEKRNLNIQQKHRSNNFDKIKIPNNYILLTTKLNYINTGIISYQHCCGEIRTKSGQEQIRCLKCYPYNKSIAENEILEFCQSLSSNVQSNSRQIIKPQELDIHIPDHNLAIEYNGLFWHSSYSIDTEDKNYHLIKTKLCKNLNIQLLHIFENEWENPNKQKIWKSIIRNKLNKSQKIFARKCKIQKISFKDSQIFLNNNHLQGQCNSSINVGLYYENELVSIMTFGKSRFNKKVDWELLRFCNKLNYYVIGAASKLFKNFLKGHTGSIVSYADMRYSDGGLYKQLGFEFSHESNPNYFYWKDGLILESRIGYQKHKLENKLEIFDETLTEVDNMYNNGYRRIYDCGNQVWIYK